MQSLTQTLKTGPEEPLLPLTECDAMMQPGESETHVQLLSEIVNQPPHSVGVTQENEKETLEEPVGEPMVDSEGRQIDPSLSPGSLEVAPGHKPASASDVETMGKIKEANDGRRYLSCMKNRRNPLLMEIPELDSSSLILDSSPLSLQCRQCHIIFNHYKSKERHLRNNHPLEYQQSALKNTLFTCYVCDHHFANSTELMTHQKAHVEKRPYKCPICGEAFYRVSELTGHKKIHFGEDGYACTTCGKACKTLTLLKYHQRKHTGEKPYACKECGKRFGFSKDVRKHMESHLQGQEGEDGTIPPPKAPGKKINNTGVSTIKYPCSLCKATFKSIKTRLCHNKKKHKFLLDTTTDALPPKYPVKQGGPIITPISISQSTFLQVEPLQQVNANIDTEQIRKLIESMENVQRVNQVVILGQVPPHIPTQGLQFPAPGAPVYLNPTPPSIEHSQTEHSNSLEMHFARGMCNYMDQTIILEPITPPNEGLEYPSFQELVSKRRSEVADLKLKPEETLAMELTSALLPVADLEKSESSHQLEVPSSSLVLATELEKSMDETVNDQDEITPPGQLLVPTVELDKTPLEAVQEDLINGPLLQKDKSTQLPYETPNNPEGEVASQIPKESIEQAHSVMESMPVEETRETHSVMESLPVAETPEPHSLRESMPVEETQEQIENGQKGEETLEQPTVENISSQEQVPLQSETKQVDSTLDSTVNVMSAQELVKVRKRRPARTFVYEEYIYQQMVSTRKRHLHTGETSAKQQPTKKNPHVIEFGPKNKEKKNQNQRKRSQSCQSTKEVKTGSKMFFTNMSEKPVAPKKIGRKSTRKHVHLSSPEDKLSNPVENIEHQGKDKKTNKLTKRKQVVTGNISKEQKDSPALKKNKIKKVPSPKLIDLNIKEKCKKVTKETDPTTQNTVINKGSINVPAQEITPDPFLLLKGHKQPQLKVYKLDPSKAAGQTQECTQEGNEDANMLLPVVRKRAGRPKKNQKAFSLLSSLVVNDPSPTTAHKPKTTRKRKSSLRIETEGVITASNSKRALECKDCGEKFNSVSSLQEHKTSMHIVESPGLTFTNGNLFEGVSGLVHQPTNKADGVIGEVSGPSYWDIEAETREVASEDKECTVSFPALNPSPSLPITEAVEASGSKEKTQIAFVADITALLDVARQHREPLTGTPLGVLVNGSPQLNGPGAEGSLASDLGLPTGPSSEGDGLIRPLHYDCGTEMKITAEDVVKDEVLLDVDIVTVGEQNDMDPPDFSQPLLIGDGNQEVVDPDVSSIQINNEKTTEITFHSSSSSTHSLEFKNEQDVESVVQKRDKSVVREVGRVSSIRGRGSGRREGSKRGLISRRITDGGNFCGRKADEEPDECQIIFQKCPLTADSELNKQDDTHSVQRSHSTPQSPQLELNQDMLPALCVPPVCSSLVDKQSEFGVQQDKETDQSAIVIPERFVTSRRMETADKKRCHLARVPGMVLGQVLDSEEIKVEDGSSSIRPDLVKQGKHLILRDPPTSEDNVIIQWNVEQMDSENIPGTETESQASSLAPDVHTKQCIFYPVKEEEREVLLCPSQREDGVIALELSSGARVDHQTEDEDNFSSGDHQETRSEDVSLSTNPYDSNTAIAQGDMEEPEDRHVRDFLLQIPEEDDSDFVEYCDPLPAPEEQAVAYLNSLKKRNQVQLNEKSLPTSEINQEDMRQPIDLFSTYFGWDTWGEIARCTNSLSKMLHLATAKEVAQFVGIHIAMGTLKFPSLKLYWQDPTKVSLIADAMPLSRFLQLAHKIKLALPEKDLTGELATQRTSKRRDVQPTIQSCSSSISSRSSNSHSFSSNDEVQNSSKRHGDKASNHENEMNPLWRLQTILHRFDAGCQLLKPEEEYAVDQFPIPLSTGKENDNVSLNCTVFIGVGGLITKLKLGVNLSDKEDAVERMAPRDSLVYLCRQDLSTPAMLERLLNAGVHGAGRVGGAIGQMGDEFISSDGRLRLRRSKGGFVLSTAGKQDQNVSELIESLERSQMLVCLNRDLHHLYRIPHTVTRSTGWPQGVLWFLTDLALVNSWLLYRQGQRTGSEPLTLMAFRLEVSKALIFSSGLATQDSVPPQPPSQSACVLTETPNPDMRQERSLPDASIRYDGSGHWPEQFEVGEGGRCRFGNCNRTSQVLCLKCCVFLCISRNHNCFMKFHNQQR